MQLVASARWQLPVAAISVGFLLEIGGTSAEGASVEPPP